MVSLNTPAERDYQSVEAYFFNKKPLVDEEHDFIYRKEDLITLRDGREMSILDSLTERLLRTFHCSLLQVSTVPLKIANGLIITCTLVETLLHKGKSSIR
jgi:hypothetical protein